MSEWNPATHPKYAAQTSHSCPSLCNPMDDSPPGSSVAGILQPTLEWGAITFSRGSSLPRSWTQVSVTLVMAGRFFSTSTTIPSAHSTELLSGDS